MLSTFLGTLPQWFTVAVLVAVAYLVARGGASTALGTLQTANRVLERRVRELEHQGKQDAQLIAQLQGKTDMALALAPLRLWTEEHERRAQERHDATLTVLGLIAERLGPEPDGSER